MKDSKRYVKILLLAIPFLLIFLYFIFINYQSSVNISDKQELIQFVEKHDKVSNITLLKTSENGELYSLIYQYKDKTRLFILEKSKFLNRYSYFGGSNGSDDFGTYNFGNPQYALIIVYGDNTKLNAIKYTMKNQDKVYSQDIENMDYVLQIYRLPSSDNINSILQLYDSKNNEIQNL